MHALFREVLDHELDFVAGGLTTEPGEMDGGSCEINTNYDLPSQYYLDQIYAVEFILDPQSQNVTTNLLLDNGSSVPSSSSKSGMESMATAAPTKCTVSVTHTTQTVSASGSVSANIGVLGGSRSTGSTTTTKSVTMSVEGQFKNGRCVVPVSR